MKFHNALDVMPGYDVLCIFGIAVKDGELFLIGKISKDENHDFVNMEIVDNLNDSTWYHVGDVTRWALIDVPVNDDCNTLYSGDQE